MMLTRLVPVVIVALGLAAGCKPANKGVNGSGTVVPDRVGSSGDAAPALKVGVLGQGGGKRLTLDLQRVPSAAESAQLYSCWSVPADDFALGKAICKGDAQKSAEITAANVEFTCLSNPDFGVVKAKRPLSLDFCTSYDVFAYQFKPAFNVKIAD